MHPDQPKNPDDFDPEKKATDAGAAEMIEHGPTAVQVPTPIPDDEDDAMVDFGHMPSSGDGAASLSHSQISGPLSGTSIVSWTDLMKARAEEDAAFDVLNSDDFDAASDRDILGRALEKEPPSDTQLHLLNDGAAEPDVFIDMNAPPGKSPSSHRNAGSSLHSEDAVVPHFEKESSESGLFRRETQDHGSESSGINLLHDITSADLSSAELMQRTDQVDSPIFFSPDDDITMINSQPDFDLDSQSSAVDFGSPSIVDMPFPLATDSNAPKSGSKTGRSKGSKSSSSGSQDSGTVDLLGASRGTGLSSIPGLTAVGSSMRPDSAMPSTARVDYAPGGRMPGWLSAALGGMTTAAVCVGLWLSGVLPGATTGTKPVSPVNTVKGTPAATPAMESGFAALDAGDFDAAVESLGGAEKTPEVKTAVGQARWLRYLKACKKSAAAPDAASEDTKLAVQDLTEANTAAATLWLGLIEESFGRLEKAKTIYKEAQDKYADQKKVFQGALDRLESKPTVPTNRAAANPAVGLAVFAMLVQVAPAELPEEAGYKYWEALRLAKKHDYVAAQAALKSAREAHEARRLLVGRKGQNPNSDPLEEIFLRSCDDLSAYWKLRDQMNSGGYNLAQYPSPASAMGSLLTHAKTSTAELKKVNNSLTAVRDVVTKAKLDSADLAGAFQKLADAKTQAEAAVKSEKKQREGAEAQAAKAEADRKPLEDAKEAAEQKYAKAVEEKGTVEAELKTVRDRLAGMKPGPAPAAGGDPAEVARLQAQKSALEEKLAAAGREATTLRSTVQDLSSFVRSVRTKVEAPADARPAEVVVALDRALAAKPVARTDMPGIPAGAYAVDQRAERAFAGGLANYRAGRYSDAERDFRTAVGMNDRDARYWYFLGLSRMGMGRGEDAQSDFRHGAELERRNLPNPSAIDRSLERLTVTERAAIDAVRRAG